MSTVGIIQPHEQTETLTIGKVGGLVTVTGAKGTSKPSASVYDAVLAYAGTDAVRYTVNH